MPKSELHSAGGASEPRPASSGRRPGGLAPRRGRRTGVRRTLLCASAWILLGNGAPLAPSEELVEAVQTRYDSVRDITARFEQESVVASIDKKEVSSGDVTIKRPGRMRWEYARPEPRVIALDGETLRMYLPGDAQLQIAPLGVGAFPPTALDFLLGNGKLDASFEAEELEDSGRPERGLRLRPRDDSSFDYLEIWVSPDDFQLRESIVVDLFGNRTAVRFQGIEENRGVEDSVFEVAVPEGTEVIDLR